MTAVPPAGETASDARVVDVTDDALIAACHDVLRHLRPHVPAEGFVARIRGMFAGGYRLTACLDATGRPVAVAGWRVLDQLVRGRMLYVDDLVTDPASRSSGLGRALLARLATEAARLDCTGIELDSGTQRVDAHRFYLRERFAIRSFHFVRPLSDR